MPTLFTIGYEGKTQDEMLDQLEAAGVAIVLDVRAVASSRRPGFSKTALAAGLSERGIDYLHLRPLGTPADGRQAARAGKIGEMRDIYARQLDTPEATLALAQAVSEASDRPAALLCYEREAADCHRSMLAGRMAGLAAFVVHDL